MENKTCPACGTICESNESTCKSCGYAFPAQSATNTPWQQTAAQVNATQGGPWQQMPTENQVNTAEPPKKSKKVLKIFLIVIAVFVVIGIVGAILSTPYTKGVYEDGVYTNEWAGFKFTPPEGMEKGSSEVYKEYEDLDPLFEVGYASVNEEIPRVAILFSSEAVKNTEEELIKDFNSQFINSKVSEATIAGEEYSFCESKYFGATLRFYVRKQDGHAVMILVAAQSAAEADSILKCFEKLD